MGSLQLARSVTLVVLGTFACSASGSLTGSTSPSSQTAPSENLVRASDLVHEGSFLLPVTGDATYAQGAIAFNPANGSLFVVGHVQRRTIAEIDIPETGAVATIRQPFRDALEGRIDQVKPGDSNGYRIGGLFVLGNSLVITAYAYYDADNSARASHFVRSVDLSEPGTLRGPFRVGSMPVGFTAGYFAPVPPAWQNTLGGDVLNGQCCIPIISRTSYGPSVSTVRSAELLTASHPNATTLLAYPSSHPTLGRYESHYGRDGSLYNGTSRARGVAFPAGTASVLFFGGTGLGEFCYGTGAKCGDPDNPDQAQHAYPYVSNVWAYDARDLAAVARGARDPWDVRPYATWQLPGIGIEIKGVATDPSTGRIYVAESFGTNSQLRIHVFSVQAATDTVPLRPITLPPPRRVPN